MPKSCPHCSTSATTELKQKTILGYRCFRCTACERRFNERTGTQFNFLEFPTDIVLLVVRWRLRYKCTLTNLLTWGTALRLTVANRSDLLLEIAALRHQLDVLLQRRLCQN